MQVTISYYDIVVLYLRECILLWTKMDPLAPYTCISFWGAGETAPEILERASLTCLVFVQLLHTQSYITFSFPNCLLPTMFLLEHVCIP